jgi:hypothetical protein
LRNHRDVVCKQAKQNLHCAKSKKEANQMARREWLASATRVALVSNLPRQVAKKRKLVK